MVSILQYFCYPILQDSCFSCALSSNLKYFCYHINEIGRELKKDENFVSPAKDTYTMSSDASFDGSKFDSSSVVIRKGVLPILRVAARIKCKTSHTSEILGIALGLLKAAKIGILNFDV